MSICSYLVIPEPGGVDAVAGRLAALPGCRVVRAENSDLLALVTEADGLAEARALRETVESTPGIHGLVLTFGEIESAGEPVR